MKNKLQELLLTAILSILLPSLLIGVLENRLPADAEDPTQTTEATQQTQQTQIPVLVENGTVIQMGLEDYISCVVLAEMPADFEPEALKAQAVAARTYTLKRHTAGDKHPGGAVCTDSACCQAYIAEDTFTQNGGTQEQLRKVKEAVAATAGQVMLYQGQLIEATYFSCSGGKTENALSVWGADIPYLQAVESPGEENAKRYMQTVRFTLEEFGRLLNQETLHGDFIGQITYTAGGGVDLIQIGESTFTGVEIRKLLGLNSTAFLITAVGDSVTVTTKGFGHRVGMSQYGADAMAVSGSTYIEILQYYYQGAVLEDYQTI